MEKESLYDICMLFYLLKFSYVFFLNCFYSEKSTVDFQYIVSFDAKRVLFYTNAYKPHKIFLLLHTEWHVLLFAFFPPHCDRGSRELFKPEALSNGTTMYRR